MNSFELMIGNHHRASQRDSLQCYDIPMFRWETMLTQCLEGKVTQLLNLHEVGAYGFQLLSPDHYSYFTNKHRGYRANVTLEPSTS